MESFRVGGFRPWLERAIRVDENHDWSAHTIDYAGFKRKMRYFSKRRTRLRSMMAASGNDSILASELDAALGSAPELPSNYLGATGTRDSSMLLLPTPRATGRTTSGLVNQLDAGHAGDMSQTDYVSFPDGTTIPVLTPASQPSQNAQEPTALEDASVPLHVDTSSHPTAATSFWPGLGPTRVKRRAVMRHVSNYERNDIVIFLAMEMDKVAMFYHSRWQHLSQLLLDYRAQITELQQQQLGSVIDGGSSSSERLVEIGHEVLELEAFVVVNLLTVRQLLIRYDAFARTFEGTPMLHYYMKMVGQSTTASSQSTHSALLSSFRKLLQHQELHALADSFLELCTHHTEFAERYQSQRREFQHVLERSERTETVASAGHAAPLQDTLLHNLRYYFLLGMIEDRLGYEPTYLVSRGTSLSEEMQVMADWRKENHHYYHLKSSDTTTTDDEQPQHLGYQQVFNLTMALLAAFLYCMNYYIVEPSSTMYVTALGGEQFMSAALIGMMPIASFMSAIVYSIWTNYSFRQPFLLSCVLMLVGNLMYGFAYNYKSLTMAFTGRFLTGLGGPKCIIRRYMADTTSLSIRTSVNAGFGMVVAAGSALGPGCAILVNKLDFSIPLPFDNEIWVNGMTGPGYLMAVLWTLFLVALSAEFEEPNRVGLEEQKRLEKGKRPCPESELSTCETAEDSQATDIYDADLATSRSPSKDSTGSRDDDLMTIFSGATSASETERWKGEAENGNGSWLAQTRSFLRLVTFPVRICLFLLFAKVFVIESLVSSTSSLSMSRYQWEIDNVGLLGCVNGFFVIPLSILVGRLSMSYQDRFLMIWLLSIGLFGVLNLIDISDFISHDSTYYNEEHPLSVGPYRYVFGYFLTYMSIQSFEGIIGSALSKVIPTALASGTLNSGLLATLVDTFGRSCGDLFISLAGYIDMRHLMNLLFVPAALILISCLWVVRRNYDLLAV